MLKNIFIIFTLFSIGIHAQENVKYYSRAEIERNAVGLTVGIYRENENGFHFIQGSNSSSIFRFFNEEYLYYSIGYASSENFRRYICLASGDVLSLDDKNSQHERPLLNIENAIIFSANNRYQVIQLERSTIVMGEKILLPFPLPPFIFSSEEPSYRVRDGLLLYFNEFTGLYGIYEFKNGSFLTVDAADSPFTLNYDGSTELHEYLAINNEFYSIDINRQRKEKLGNISRRSDGNSSFIFKDMSDNEYIANVQSKKIYRLPPMENYQGYIYLDSFDGGVFINGHIFIESDNQYELKEILFLDNIYCRNIIKKNDLLYITAMNYGIIYDMSKNEIISSYRIDDATIQNERNESTFWIINVYPFADERYINVKIVPGTDR
jgi:hypothetical protein